MGARQRCERGVASPQALRCATQPRATFPNNSANCKTVVCDLTQERAHGCRVGWCYVDGQDKALVRAGLARDCPRYSGGRYAAVEPAAAAAREPPFAGVLSARLVTGSLGGAERIVVSQLAGTGMVKVYSSGSALDGGPPMYLHSPSQHGHGADFREIASFNPFGGAPGTQVATTSTPYGANLLVSGVSPHDPAVLVLKYELVRPDSHGAMLEAALLGEVTAVEGSGPAILGGD